MGLRLLALLQIFVAFVHGVWWKSGEFLNLLPV